MQISLSSVLVAGEARAANRPGPATPAKPDEAAKRFEPLAFPEPRKPAAAPPAPTPTARVAPGSTLDIRI